MLGYIKKNSWIISVSVLRLYYYVAMTPLFSAQSGLFNITIFKIGATHTGNGPRPYYGLVAC